MNQLKFFNLSIVVLIFAIVLGCGGGSGGSEGSNNSDSPPAGSSVVLPFNSIISENEAVIKEIVDQQNFPIYYAVSETDIPPTLNGTYESSLTVTASDIEEAIGETNNTAVILSNQDNVNGKIDYEEIIGGITAGAAGTYYIEGFNDAFTITLKSTAEVGECTVTNAVLISGYQLGNGDLEVETLSINLSKSGCEAYTVAEWHETEGMLILQSSDILNTYYKDSDLDGFGNPAVLVESYSPPSGYVDNDYDCDDSNADINPDATEVCDYVDNNCDGQTDEGFNDSCQLITFFQDSDLDGFGNPTVSVDDYNPPAGYVLNDNDCDDTDADINPDAVELCDNIDNNCNGQIDEGFNNLCQKELNLIPTDDTYIDEEYPNENYGNSTIIKTENFSTGYTKYGLIKFNLDAFLLDSPSNIIEAKLTITGITHADAGLANIWFYQIGGSDWDESTVTYNSRPMGQIRSVVLNNTAYNDIAIEIDVSSFVEGWINGDENYGIKIQSYLVSGTSCVFYSKEFGNSVAAILELIYE
jgi:hypothetical protein